MTALSLSVSASTWSINELHIQKGNLIQPFAREAGTKAQTLIFTFQHASGWEYGQHFLFVDYASVGDEDTLYAEWYPTLSSSAFLATPLRNDWLKDISLVMGFNMAPEADVLKYLPGIQFQFDVEGFHFLNLTLTAYIDDSEGLEEGGAPKHGDSWMVDVAWRYALPLQSQQFYIEGHVEYIDERASEVVGVSVESWLLAQVQVRWDVGKAWFDVNDRVYLGVEYQYWNNKLGTQQDENTVQALGVWRF